MLWVNKQLIQNLISFRGWDFTSATLKPYVQRDLEDGSVQRSVPNHKVWEDSRLEWAFLCGTCVENPEISPHFSKTSWTRKRKLLQPLQIWPKLQGLVQSPLSFVNLYSGPADQTPLLNLEHLLCITDFLPNYMIYPQEIFFAFFKLLLNFPMPVIF